MSLYQLFKNAIPRLTRTEWGSRIVDRDGTERDSGVNDLAEEIAAILASQAPLALDEPIRVIKNYTGTTFEVVTEPNVEAANDPLSVDAFGGVKLSLEDVRDAAVEAQRSADAAIAAAAAAARKIVAGIVKVEGDQVVLDAQNQQKTTLYSVQIFRDGDLVEVPAYPYRSGDRTFPVNTRVIVHLVGDDEIVQNYLNNKDLLTIPNYFFVEPYTTA